MGGGERRHPRRPFARRLVGRSLDLRRAARRRHPVRGHAFAPLWRKTGRRLRRRMRSPSRSPIPPNVVSRRRRKAAPLFSPLAPPGIASLCVSFPLRSAWPIRRRSPRPLRVTGCRSRRAFRPLFWPRSQPPSRPSCALGRSARPTARRSRRRLFLAYARSRGRRQASNLTDLGSCAFRSEIAAMRHETQYSRLFRS